MVAFHGDTMGGSVYREPAPRPPCTCACHEEARRFQELLAREQVRRIDDSFRDKERERRRRRKQVAEAISVVLFVGVMGLVASTVGECQGVHETQPAEVGE